MIFNGEIFTYIINLAYKNQVRYEWDNQREIQRLTAFKCLSFSSISAMESEEWEVDWSAWAAALLPSPDDGEPKPRYCSG